MDLFLPYILHKKSDKKKRSVNNLNIYNTIEANFFCLNCLKFFCLHVTYRNQLEVAPMKNPSPMKNFLPSCFKIRPKGFLWIQQRN